MKRIYECVCGEVLFFRSGQCPRCERALGFCTETGLVEPLEPLGETSDRWRFARDDGAAPRAWWRCANLETPSDCNWLLPVDDARDPARPRLCAACGLNRVVPDWSVEENARRWRRIEIAKRRVISSVLGMGLPLCSRFDGDPYEGLAFDVLAPLPGSPPVMTGHVSGVITVNLDEADDQSREAMRLRMHEPYRTVLGHLRHEIGHYYWDVLVRDEPERLEAFRAVFGDERADYAAALATHYDAGPPADWRERWISGYASSHPWEDWAETWAHYMHMVDALDTASSLGLNIADTVIEPAPDALPVPPGQAPARARSAYADLFDAWSTLVRALNQMSRSMGERDFYPFVVADAARQKLEFVHDLIAACRERRLRLGDAPAAAGPSSPMVPVAAAASASPPSP